MKYDAFISYRHGGVDQFVAETLHKKLEAFKLPKRLLEKGNGKTRITRVFRDQDELPLSSNLEDSIKDALRESEWLIVICTPRLKDSIWCLKEIETFTEMHGQDHILAVLVEGEPDESFPQSLRSHKVTKLDAVTGNTIEFDEKIEPLAADIRASSNSKIKKVMEVEILRLLAPMFGVDFDDLRQRQRARRIRRISILASIVIFLSLGFAIYSYIMYWKISLQKDEIESQKIEIEAKNADILDKNAQIEAQMEELLYSEAEHQANQSLLYTNQNAKDKALQVSYDILTGGAGYDLPYTSYGELALSEALDMYHYDHKMRSVDKINIGNQIVDFSTNGTIDYFLVQCTDGTVALYSREDKKVIWEGKTKYNDNLDKSDILSGFVNGNDFVVANGIYLNFYTINSQGEVEELKTVNCKFDIDNLYIRYDLGVLVALGLDDGCVVDTVNQEILYKADTNTLAYSLGGRVGLVEGNSFVIYSSVDSDEPVAEIEIPAYSSVHHAYMCEDYENSDIVYFSVGYTILKGFDARTVVYAVDLTAGTQTPVANVEPETTEPEEVEPETTDDGAVDPEAEGESEATDDVEVTEEAEPTEAPVVSATPAKAKILWTNNVDTYDSKVTNLSYNGEKLLVLYSRYAIFVYNAETGEYNTSYSGNENSDEIVDIVAYDTTFAIITGKGTIYYYMGDLGFTSTLTDIVVGNSYAAKMHHATSDYGICFPAVMSEDTAITIFAFNNPRWLKEIDMDDIKSGTDKCENFYESKARDEGVALGLEDGNLFSSLAVIDDLDICVALTSSDMRVYNTETKEILYETTYVYGRYLFNGKYAVDSEGNIYVFSNYGAFVFNSDYEFIANCCGVCDFDAANECMVFDSVYGFYEGHLKTLDELLEYAEAVMAE